MQDKDKKTESATKTVVDLAVDALSSAATTIPQAVMDSHPSVTAGQRAAVLGPLHKMALGSEIVQRREDAKEKYGEEDATTIAAVQAITSTTTGHVLGGAGAVACAPLGPVAQAVCAISGEVLGSYIHDNVEIDGKTINDHVGDFIATNRSDASSEEGLPTCSPAPKTQPPKNNADKPNCKPGSSDCSTSDPCKVDKSFLASRGGGKGKGGSGGGGRVVDSGGNPVRSSGGGHVNSGG